MDRPLSPKQLEVCRALVERDDPVKILAADLGMSEKTFATHTYLLFKKLNVHTRAELVTKIRGGIELQVVSIDVPLYIRAIDARLARIEDSLVDMGRLLRKEE